MRSLAASLTFVVLGTGLCGQAPLTRFFTLPDTSPLPGSDSFFSDQAGAVPFAFDFAEDIRFNKGGVVTLSQVPGTPHVWDVVDFRLPGTDLGLGSKVTFCRPATPGPFGTWTSSSPIGFPDFSTVTVTMTGELTATGPLAGAFPSTTTLTMSGTIVPGYYHNVILLTGSFSGVPNATVALYMKNDFFPPAVTWEMVVLPASWAQPGGAPASSSMVGGFTMRRGITTPNVYDLENLAIEVLSTPPVVITTPPGQGAGTLTFDALNHTLTGALTVLVDGVPETLNIGGGDETYEGSVMRPTGLVIDEQAAFGSLTGIHLELATTELVPPTPPVNDFQIGLVTSLAMRGRAGHFYAVGASFTSLPGINTPVGDIPIMPDALLWISIDPLNPFFLNGVGFMPASGEVLVQVAVPNDPVLIGVTFFMGGATFDPVTLAVRAATNSHRVIVK